MAERVVFLLALYRTFSGLPVPFCIDFAISKCLEQKIHHSIHKTSSPKKKIHQLFYASNGGMFFYDFSAPKRAKSGVRHHLLLTFPSQVTKEGFLSRLDRAKQRLFPGGWYGG